MEEVCSHAETVIKATLSEERRLISSACYEDGVMERNYLFFLIQSHPRIFCEVSKRQDGGWKILELPTRVDIVRSFTLMECYLVQPGGA